MLPVTIEFDEALTEYGLWCATCQLPSALRLHFVGLTAEGVHPDLATRTVCPGCSPALFCDN